MENCSKVFSFKWNWSRGVLSRVRIQQYSREEAKYSKGNTPHNCFPHPHTHTHLHHYMTGLQWSKTLHTEPLSTNLHHPQSPHQHPHPWPWLPNPRANMLHHMSWDNDLWLDSAWVDWCSWRRVRNCSLILARLQLASLQFSHSLVQTTAHWVSSSQVGDK